MCVRACVRVRDTHLVYRLFGHTDLYGVARGGGGGSCPTLQPRCLSCGPPLNKHNTRPCAHPYQNLVEGNGDAAGGAEQLE